MQINELEYEVLTHFLAHELLRRRWLQPETITVVEREHTGVGFFTEFAPSEQLLICANDYSRAHSSNLVLRLNSNVDSGYILYIEGGYLKHIEGFAFDYDWPTHIDDIETVISNGFPNLGQ
ncbi:hypothetical protein [Aestuariispira ectoiniformans]|uniref:hypothetical protein n=1 Tax=Aestuariispira ectoiniformans TaxID=2775080 RepID=UPI00223B97CC|nr:hypothetical protein [Aestuariispira ectoiniformans]